MKKKILLPLVSILLTLLVLFLIGEVSLRYRRSGNQPNVFAVEFVSGRGEKLSNEVGQLRLMANPYTVYSNFPSQHTEKYFINSRGLRNEEGAENIQKPKIVILGGSAAFGLGVADADTISRQLDLAIPTHLTLNAGVTGFLSGQELTLFVTSVADQRPEVVIAYDGWNDLYDPLYGPRDRYPGEMGCTANFLRFQDKLAQEYRNESQLSSSTAQIFRTALSKSLVLEWFRQRYQFDAGAWGCDTNKSAAERATRNNEVLNAAVDAYIQNVARLSIACKAYDAEFILVNQPELGAKASPTQNETEVTRTPYWACYQTEFPDLYRQFVAKAQVRLEQLGIQYINLNQAAEFRDSKESLFIDPVHTNRLGNEKVVSSLLPTIKSLIEKHQAKAKL